MTLEKFNFKHFITITLLTSIWIHISEIFRYFIFVVPSTQSFFDHKSGIADIDVSIFAIWGFWDTLLTAILVFFFWLYSRVFGYSNRSVLASGTILWLAIFVIFWIATANMGLAEWNMLWVTLPLSWLEMIVGTWIASKLYKKYEK
ncbi:hypothetical protein [uncultured Kordia sp.]|uniref:hypothetical protein n=1 Tax=uncultured Kordia sp. TaxID=507699 RepID=UPI00262A3657|nr:hypothetical protein [uncultured Kordia sp.]